MKSLDLNSHLFCPLLCPPLVGCGSTHCFVIGMFSTILSKYCGDFYQTCQKAYRKVAQDVLLTFS